MEIFQKLLRCSMIFQICAGNFRKFHNFSRTIRKFLECSRCFLNVPEFYRKMTRIFQNFEQSQAFSKNFENFWKLKNMCKVWLLVCHWFNKLMICKKIFENVPEPSVLVEFKNSIKSVQWLRRKCQMYKQTKPFIYK